MGGFLSFQFLLGQVPLYGKSIHTAIFDVVSLNGVVTWTAMGPIQNDGGVDYFKRVPLDLNHFTRADLIEVLREVRARPNWPEWLNPAELVAWLEQQLK